ncbi:4-coumarate--CoA ligase family protein [Solihabitans fulvus]|uniref:4-coumarate--CoA ligase family protein n=1 Tax=Solihabitans fulvus TaxID=1892852 RepID=A0A5B2XF85_9PSEU|nr:AMP-binding protein [Solihabitans fulvus]KAA2261973.1 4-coumarate--CoA ligase family protein [Solihabitans fulvus]
MVFASPFPDVATVDEPVHVHVLSGAAARGDHPALIDAGSGETVTYAELAGSVERLAAGFAEAGLRKGDVLALHSPNSVLFPVVLFAASRLGVVVTTLNALSTAGELATQLADARARLVVTVSALLPAAVAAAAQAGVEEVLVCDTAEGHRSVQELLASTAPVPEVPIDVDNDLFVLPYSSGTTARPKGVMLCHRSVATNMDQVHAAWTEIGPDTRAIAVLPFFHIFGMAMLFDFLSRGATLVVLPRFDLKQFLAGIAEYRVNRLIVVPPIVLGMAKHPAVDDYDLSSLTMVFSAAAPLDPDLAGACAARLGVPVVQGYGMTELSPGTHLVPDGETDPAPGTVGKLLPGTRARLVDPETGVDVGADEVGELLISGPQVMKGYFGQPEETDAAIDADGWLHTGDLASVDDRGNWFIVDRVKELIKYKGYQVPPAELEAVLLSHPGIADTAVIGRYNADGDEEPVAFVVPTPGAGLTAESVKAYVAERVAPYRKVRQVEFVDAIPRATSGKILRRELRQRPPSAM